MRIAAELGMAPADGGPMRAAQDIDADRLYSRIKSQVIGDLHVCVKCDIAIVFCTQTSCRTVSPSHFCIALLRFQHRVHSDSCYPTVFGQLVHAGAGAAMLYHVQADLASCAALFRTRKNQYHVKNARHGNEVRCGPLRKNQQYAFDVARSAPVTHLSTHVDSI
jgi:hypothetical protein